MNIPFKISSPDKAIEENLLEKINFKTKPTGALGKLEEIALKIGLIQQSETPSLQKPHIVVFAGDHGIALEGVSAYPQEVTYQMVLNFLGDGAAINVFTRQHDIDLTVVDAGVNHEFGEIDDVRFKDEKIGFGTESFLNNPAMTDEQCELAIKKGAEIVNEIHKVGTNIIGFGEMGISNTSSASLIMSSLLEIPVLECIGKGTGLDQQGLDHKIAVLSVAQANHSLDSNDPFKVLKTFGGFEIAMMCGAFLKAAELKMTIMVDGFIASASFLCAYALNHQVLEYAIFCHQSNEQGHQKLLDALDVNPVLNMNMRLGEGTGCALAYPVIKSSLHFLNEMSSFKDAGVSTKD